MKAHRSLSRQDVLKYPAHKIALMVASEFLRAADRAAHQSIVENCFHRARELMGLLETIDLPLTAALHLKPIYKRCRESALIQGDSANPLNVSRISRELANEFSQAAERMLTHA